MRKSLILAAALVLLATSTTGCYRQTFKYENKTPAATTEVNRGFLLWGLVAPDNPVKAFEICPSGVAQVEVVHTFGNQLLGCITAGIYSPNTVRVSCAGGSAHNFYLDEDEEVVGYEGFDEDGELVERSISSEAPMSRDDIPMTSGTF
jgi:hypothetical protein